MCIINPKQEENTTINTIYISIARTKKEQWSFLYNTARSSYIYLLGVAIFLAEVGLEEVGAGLDPSLLWGDVDVGEVAADGHEGDAGEDAADGQGSLPRRAQVHYSIPPPLRHTQSGSGSVVDVR